MIDLLNPPGHYLALVFDVDGTLQNNREYDHYGQELELCKLADFLKASGGVEEIRARLEKAKAEIMGEKGPQYAVPRLEAVQRLGLTMAQWDAIREPCYKPEWLRPNLELIETLRSLQPKLRMAAASNATGGLTRRAIENLQLQLIFEHVCGTDDLNLHKPNSEFFRAMASRLGIEPYRCVAIGDKPHFDLEPARKAGFGGTIHVSSIQELVGDLRVFLTAS